MDSILRVYKEIMSESDDVISILLIDNRDKCSSLLGGASLVSIVIVNRAEPRWKTRQYRLKGIDIIEHCISQWQMEQWAVYGIDEGIAVLVDSAVIVTDPVNYMASMKKRLSRLSPLAAKIKVCEEYCRFLKRFLEAKELLRQNRTFDAYYAVLNALHSWARLVLFEAGEMPFPDLWKKVKQVDSSIHKLYEELISGPEALEKRIELVMLPSEFSIMSKMRGCTKLITDILQSHQRPWLLSELENHPDVVKAKIDLSLLLDKMVKKSLIHQVYLKQHGHDIDAIAYVSAI